MENTNQKSVNTSHRNTFWTCFSKHLAGYLLMNNCVLIGTERNRDNEKFIVFKFLKEGDKVTNLVEKYKEEYKNS
jgi:hypothetical protein